MAYTHSHTGNINMTGTNQSFKQCQLVVVFALSLLGLTAINSVRAANDCESFLSCCDTGTNCRQFYLGGIVGADFGTLNKEPGTVTAVPQTAVPNQSLFTTGGTLGIRSLRDNGAWRFEFEGRGREQISATDTIAGGSATVAARDGWSTMVNIWRDYNVVGDVALYAGAGIGAGGYRSVVNASITGVPGSISSNENVSNFAWQAGGGVIYNVSKHIAVDLGYRFFSIGDNTENIQNFGVPGEYITNYSASELLLTVRIYEPFRRWR